MNRSNFSGKLSTIVAYNDWTCDEACLTVMEYGPKLIIGTDLCNSLCLAVVQQQSKRGKCVNNIDSSTCKIKETVASKFPHLVSRIGLSKTHVVKKVSSKVYSKASKMPTRSD